MEEKDGGTQHVSDLDIHPQSDRIDGTTAHSLTAQMKHNSKGILLVPQPSDDPRDPLVSLTKGLQKWNLLTLHPELVVCQEGYHTSNHLPRRLLGLVFVSCKHLRLFLPSHPVPQDTGGAYVHCE